MSPQEMQVLESFLNQLVQARAVAKDPQAQAMIANAVAKQPDAAYLLVQRALLLDQALAAAKAQISTLQGQLQAAQAPGASAFLDPAAAWGNSAAARPASASVMSAPAPAASPQQAPYSAVPPARPGFLSGGMGGALGNIAATAAGVAGGAFLFQGIEGLLHRNSGSGFLGQSPAGLMPEETTVVNNYYGNDEPARERLDDTASDNGFLDDGLDNSDFSGDDSSLI